MRIEILGAGVVGQSIGSRLAEIGHEVNLGSRSAQNQNTAEWSQKVGAGASHGTFADAKATVSALLESFGWKEQEILDLGDITAARGTEMLSDHCIPCLRRVAGMTMIWKKQLIISFTLSFCAYSLSPAQTGVSQVIDVGGIVSIPW